MTCGIYKITNNINGKAYIGASGNIEKRWKHHRGGYTSIGKFIEKYGIHNFTFEILEECSIDELRDKERHYIKVHNTKIPNGYNRTNGGEYKVNTTGYYNVSKLYVPNLHQGFKWGYSYFDESNKKHLIASTDLNLLKKIVLSKGLRWAIIDEEKAKKSDQLNKPKGARYTKNNRSGFYKVSRSINKNAPQGFHWIYDDINNRIRRVDLEDLKKEVLSLGLPWEVVDENKANKSWELNKKNKDVNNQRGNKTGYYRVSKERNDKYTGGYIWEYRYSENNNKKKIRRSDLNELKKEVLSRGLPWKILDEEKARISNIENEKIIFIRNNTTNNNTGFYNVSKVKLGSPSRYTYVYYYRVGGLQKRIYSKDICSLEKKVKNKGLPWRIVDKNKVQHLLNQTTLI